MTKISVYQIDEYVTADDKWIGTDVNTYNKTKNFTPRKLAVYFNGNQVINTGVDLLYKYFTITPPEDRPAGTLSFETEIGPTVNFSAISTFLLSKTTQKGNDVSEFLNFLVNSTSLIYKAKNINLFGSYKIVSVEPYFLDPNFFVVNVDFLDGNGFIEEDEDYMISIVDLDRTVEVPQLVKETFDYTSSNSFVVANEINNILQVIVNTTSLHPEAYSYTLPSTVTVINELYAGDVVTIVYNYLEEFLEVPDLQRVTNIGNHTTNNIVIDNVPGEWGDYTTINTINDLGAFQSFTSPTNIDYQSEYSGYGMYINEIYSATDSREMYIESGTIQTSYTDVDDYNEIRMYSGSSTEGPVFSMERNYITCQLKINDMTESIILQIPNKPEGTYTIATTADVSPNYWTKTGDDIVNNNSGNTTIKINSGTGKDFYIKDYNDTQIAKIIGSGNFISKNSTGAGAFLFSDEGTGVIQNGYGKIGFNSYATSGSLFSFIPKYTSTTASVTQNIIDSAYSISPTSGTANIRMINLEPTINQTGGANGIVHGIRIAPTLTAAADFRAIEVTAGKVIVPTAVNSNEAVNKGQLDAVIPTFLEFSSVNSTVWNNGKGNISSNLSFGEFALNSVTTGYGLVAYGNSALRFTDTGAQSVAVGNNALTNNTSGAYNVAIGVSSMSSHVSGDENTAVGTTSGNVYALNNRSVFIGNGAQAQANNQTNQIVIGYNATGAGSNTATLGNDSITSTILKGLVKAPLTTNALIDADTTGKAVVTKEYVNNRLVLEKSGNYTLVDADSGGIIIFTASATLTIPTGLADGFECTFVTLSGVTLTVVSTGNTLNNATSTTMLPQLSFTLKRMLAANTYIVAGSL